MALSLCRQLEASLSTEASCTPQLRRVNRIISPLALLQDLSHFGKGRFPCRLKRLLFWKFMSSITEDKNPEVAEPKVWGDLRPENLEDAVESLSRSIWGILQASGACPVDLGNGIGGDDGHQHADVVWIFRWSRASINSQWAGATQYDYSYI